MYPEKLREDIATQKQEQPAVQREHLSKSKKTV